MRPSFGLTSGDEPWRLQMGRGQTRLVLSRHLDSVSTPFGR